MSKSAARQSSMLLRRKSGMRLSALVSAPSFILSSRRSLPDPAKLRLFTLPSIEMFEGPLFTAFRISSGIEF